MYTYVHKRKKHRGPAHDDSQCYVPFLGREDVRSDDPTHIETGGAGREPLEEMSRLISPPPPFQSGHVLGPSFPPNPLPPPLASPKWNLCPPTCFEG